jgi:hypothetical protein
VRFAKDTSGSDDVAALTRWDLDKSEKRGRVVYDLIGRSLLEQPDGDCLADFNGRFELSS